MKATLDATQVTRAYGQALRKLAELSGFDQKRVLLGEAGIILKTWAGRVKVAPQNKTDLRSRSRLFRNLGLTQATHHDLTVNVGLKGEPGRVWRRVGKKKLNYLLIGQMNRNFTSVRWREPWQKYSSVIEPVLNLIDQLPPATERGRKSIGLSRQSVLQIADSLGIDLNSVKGGGSLSAAGIAKARGAIAANGTAYKNGTGTATGDKIQSVVTLINRLPYGVKIGMDRQLLSIMSGRAKFFEQSYAKGAFDSMTSAARAFPWMRVTAPAGIAA